MSVFFHYFNDSFSRLGVSLFHDPVFDGIQYSPLLPQSGVVGICLVPLWILQVVIIFLFSGFFAEVIRVTMTRFQGANTNPSAIKTRVTLIKWICFILFVILGCAAMWYTYRDFYIP